MFPLEFMAGSRNRKWMVVEEFKATLKDQLVGTKSDENPEMQLCKQFLISILQFQTVRIVE